MQKCLGGVANFWFESVGAFLFKKQFFVSKYVFHVLLDCNLFEINIRYGFGDIK